MGSEGYRPDPISNIDAAECLTKGGSGAKRRRSRRFAMAKARQKQGYAGNQCSLIDIRGDPETYLDNLSHSDGRTASPFLYAEGT